MASDDEPETVEGAMRYYYFDTRMEWYFSEDATFEEAVQMYGEAIGDVNIANYPTGGTEFECQRRERMLAERQEAGQQQDG